MKEESGSLKRMKQLSVRDCVGAIENTRLCQHH